MSKFVIGFNTLTCLVVVIVLSKPLARVAVIVTVPGVRAVIFPDDVIDTTEVLLLVHVIVLYDEVVGNISVVYWNSSPISICFNVLS